MSAPTPPDQRDRQDAYREKAERGHQRGPSGVVSGGFDSQPSVPRSVFSGVGVFTAWDNHAAVGLKADWVAMQLDVEGGGGESIGSLRQAGFGRVFGWQARPDGVARCIMSGRDGYIGQAESADQYEACLALRVPHGYPHALVGNVGDWWDSERVKAAGWELILEAYDNAQPGLHTRLDSKGYPVASLLFGCYDASGEQADGSRVSLEQYRAWYPGPDWSVYLAETLISDDRAVLGG